MGQQLSPSELRTTEFAPAHEAEPSSTNESESPAAPPHAVTYGPPQWARSSFTHGFPGSAFTPQPDGSLRCPANHPLYRKARRPERDGTLRLLYAARIGPCRACPLRAQCQESSTTLKPRRKSRGALAALLFSRRILAGTSPNPCSSFFCFGARAATGHVAASGESG